MEMWLEWICFQLFVGDPNPETNNIYPSLTWIEKLLWQSYRVVINGPVLETFATTVIVKNILSTRTGAFGLKAKSFEYHSCLELRCDVSEFIIQIIEAGKGHRFH